MDFSIAIGIEKYINLRDTIYARNDAITFKKTIDSTINPNYSIELLDNTGTYKNIESHLKDIASKISENDRFFFYFAGHGMNYFKLPHLSCYDSSDTDESTWLNTFDIIKCITDTGCPKIILFLDACESAIGIRKRKNYQKFSIEELKNSLQENNYVDVYCSTSSKGVADVWDEKKHGIWSYYLFEALSGNDKKALNEDFALTNNTLRNYLSIRVKNFTKSSSNVSIQIPQGWGVSEAEYLIHQFHENKIQKYDAIPVKSIMNIKFVYDNFKKVNKLSGFKKGVHTIPKIYSSSTKNFIGLIAKKEIMDNMDYVTGKLRKKYDLKSKDYLFEINESSAVFDSSYFTYTYQIDLNEDNLSEVVCKGVLIPKNIDKLLEFSDDLDKCFCNWFDYLVYDLSTKIDLDDLITKIESEMDNIFSGFIIDYDVNKTYLSIFNKKLNRDIIFREHEIRIEFQSKESIENMLDGLKNLSNQMLLVSDEYKLLDT